MPACSPHSADQWVRSGTVDVRWRRCGSQADGERVLFSLTEAGLVPLTGARVTHKI